MFRFAAITVLGVVTLASAGCSEPTPTPVTPAVSAPGPLIGNSEMICGEWNDLYNAYSTDGTDSAAAAKAYFAMEWTDTSDTRRRKIEKAYFGEQAKAVWDLAKRADDPRVRTVLIAQMNELTARAKGRDVAPVAAREVMMTCSPA